MPARVVLAMSGGVDSSVAACLLKRQGYDVIGLFMRTGVHAPEGHGPAHKKGCCSAVDAGDARRVADRLDIPVYALDFEDDFGRIMDYFVDTEGHVLGPHAGIENFTIGQRKGLGFGSASRRYVLDIIPETREVVIGDREELLSSALHASRVNWLIDVPSEPLRCQAKIRY